MRRASCLLLVVVAFAAAQDAPAEGELSQRTLKAGQVGTMPGKFVVLQVGKTYVHLHKSGVRGSFVARVKTAGLADRDEIELPGKWNVTGPKKFGTRTLYVLEPAEKD